MLYLILLILISLTVAVAQNEAYTFDTKYIDVPLDHFSYRENTTFKLKYLVNDTFFGPNGTIFFYTGNEGDIEMFAQNSGFMFDIAPQFNALIVFAEHRYYGESLPFGNLSYTSAEYLGYLSTSQALADFVYLTNELQKVYATVYDNKKKPPVVAFGGSYGGSLAAWMKMKYPNSIIGALASSAPIWTYKGQNSCGAYYRVITDDFNTLGSEKCTKVIKDSWRIIRSYTDIPIGKSELADLWNFCQPFKTDEDINLLIGWLSDIYTVLAETNYPYQTNFITPLPANPIKEFCAKIDAHVIGRDVDLLMALGEALQIYTNYSGTTKCNEFKISEQFGVRPWNFQVCTELIIPACSKDADMFENYEYDFKAFSDNCYKQFGIRPWNEEVPILEYGDKDLSAAKNIIFSNGLLDPCSAYGVLTNVTSNIVAIVIPEGAHHSDLRASNEKDPESVKVARLIEIHHIRNWVESYHKN